jgi:SAM-dependent methyltransferase
MTMHPNYDYVLEQCRHLTRPGERILDFGCGAGICVVAGRTEGLDMFGVDIFSEAHHKEAVIASKLLGEVVFETTERGRLPFDDDYFDVVFANVVFEHVSDIDHTLREIARVLKPGGRLLTIFPGKECFLEGHVRIPFIHWFSPASRLRYPYMRLMRSLGLGGGGAGKPPATWARDQLLWMDQYTYYRTPRQINASFKAAGFSLIHLEEEYIRFRLARRGLKLLSRFAASRPVSTLSRLFCRVYGSQSILATKREMGSSTNG